MGFKDRNDQWTEHNTQFNALLQTLSGASLNGEENLQLASLEKKSQNSKVRVHYKKFTRGKDLSRCSEKDLANIFGKKTLSFDINNEIKDGKNKETSVESMGNTFMQNRGSMLDYFKKKLPNYAKNSYQVGSNGVLTKSEDNKVEKEEECTQYSGFGYSEETIKKRSSIEEIVTPKKKLKKNEEFSDSPMRRLKIEDCQSPGISNPGFEPLGTKLEISRQVLNTINEENEDFELKAEESSIENLHKSSTDGEESTLKMKKAKKKKSVEKLALDNPFFNTNDSSIVEEAFEAKRNKPKKKKNQESNSVFENSSFNGIASIGFKEKKKPLSLDNPSFNDSSNNEMLSINEKFEVKRKKKKMKRNEKEDKATIDDPNIIFGLNNPTFNENNGPEYSVSSFCKDFEVKRKKNKTEKEKNIKTGLNNPIFNENGGPDCQLSSFREDFEVKRKVKRKKTTDSGFDNPNFDNTPQKTPSSFRENSFGFTVNANFNDTPDLVSSISSKVKKKKKKGIEDKTLELSNPNFSEAPDLVSSKSLLNEDFEVKRKKKKKLDDNQTFGHSNPNFNDTPDLISSNSSFNENFEVKRKKKNCQSETSKNEDHEKSTTEANKENDVAIDLMLNVTCTPVTPIKPTTSTNRRHVPVKRRKSVRFSDVTEERIIPNQAALDRSELFAINTQVIEQSDHVIDEMSKRIDGFQAEIENDMNEAKVALTYVGEVGAGSDGGDHEKLEEGTRLRFSKANFGRVAVYRTFNSLAKSSYKHLIKGDVVVGFPNSNLHEIRGYGQKKEV